MFAALKTVLERIARAGALLRAFALLEDAPARAAPARGGAIREHSSIRPEAYGPASVCERNAGAATTANADARTHPHSRAVDRVWLTRRAGAPAPRPAVCLTPVTRVTARPLRQPAS
jgi:hypothetical protein